MVPELELTSFTSLPEEGADQVRIGKEACAIGDLSVHIIT